jgi:hypothetical protein
VGRIRPGESGTVEIELKAGISGAEDQQENGREEALFQAFQGYDLRAAAWPRAQGHRAIAVSGRERRARPSLDLRRKHEGAGPWGREDVIQWLGRLMQHHETSTASSIIDR